MHGLKTRVRPCWRMQLPRSKREAARSADRPTYKETKLASREELEGMDRAALIMQKHKRLELLKQMVGTLYPRMVEDEIERIEELLADVD